MKKQKTIINRLYPKLYKEKGTYICIMEPINKYHNAKIYKIVDNNYSKMYIGSTTQSLSKRMGDHRSSYLSKHRYTTANKLFEEFGVHNCKIELIQAIKCENKEELSAIEGHHIRKNICVNRNIAGRTQQEYNKLDTSKLRCREYKAKHKEELQEKNKTYYIENKEKIAEKHFCKCGAYSTTSKRKRHERSMKHQNFIQSQLKSIKG